MMGGPWGAAAGAGLGALGSIFGGMLGGQKETKLQGQQKQLVDQLLGSLQGKGPYSDLFSADEGTFNRMYAEPARRRFQNITAPQIQQQYLAAGQEGGSALPDELMRAGVDMDAMLNQGFQQFQQGGQNRQMDMLSRILSQQGAPDELGFWDKLKGGVGGYLSSPSFGQGAKDIFGAFNQPKPPLDQSIVNPPLPTVGFTS